MDLKYQIENAPIEGSMDSEQELIKAVKSIVMKRGREAVKIARKEILKTAEKGGIVSEALEHFAKVTLAGGLPVFPALVSLCREAVDGKTEKTAAVGAALTIIAGTADVHDDIIDQSAVKYSKKTVFGKFGGPIALLAGDALLSQGLVLLLEECEALSRDQRKAIMSLVSDAVFEIGNAEAIETRLMRRIDIEAEDLFAVIKLKAVVPEVHCKIGGILGGASEEVLESLGIYGRTFGVASLVRDEFLDMLDCSELQNRLRNECPPLPMLYALKNPGIKNSIEEFLHERKLRMEDFQAVSTLVLESMEAKALADEVKPTIQMKLSPDPFQANPLTKRETALLLRAAISGL